MLLVVLLLAWSVAAAVQPPKPSKCSGAPSSEVYQLANGIFASPATNPATPDRIFVQKGGEDGHYAIRLFAFTDGRPVWYYTQPFLPEEGVAIAPLFQRTRDPISGLTTQTEAGELALAMKLGLSSQVAMVYKIGTKDEVFACYSAVMSQTSSTRATLEKYEPQPEPHLEQDWAISAHHDGSTGLLLLSIYDQAGLPVWLTANDNAMVSPWQPAVIYRYGAAGSLVANVGHLQMNDIQTTEATLAIQVAGASGLPVTLPDGSGSLQWVVPESRYLAQLDVATITVASAAGCTVNSAGKFEIDNSTLGGPVTCQLQVDWDMGAAPSGSRIIRYGQFGHRKELSLDRTGQVQDSVTPNQIYHYQIEKAPLPGNGDYGEIVQAANDVAVVAKNTESTLNPVFAECSLNGEILEGVLPLPGRWRDPRLAPGDNFAISASPSWDFEVRATSNPDAPDVRVTVHTYNAKGEAVWLRSAWVAKTGSGAAWSGRLRRYRWDPIRGWSRRASRSASSCCSTSVAAIRSIPPRSRPPSRCNGPGTRRTAMPAARLPGRSGRTSRSWNA